MSKQFTWLERDSTWNGATLLEQGKTYKVADFGEDVVSWWVEQEAASYVGTKKEKGEVKDGDTDK